MYKPFCYPKGCYFCSLSEEYNAELYTIVYNKSFLQTIIIISFLFSYTHKMLEFLLVQDSHMPTQRQYIAGFTHMQLIVYTIVLAWTGHID